MTQTYDEEIQQKMIEEREKQLIEVRSWSEGDLQNYLEESLLTTNTIIRGCRMADQVNVCESILFNGMWDLKIAVENALEWLEAQKNDNNNVNEDAESVSGEL